MEGVMQVAVDAVVFTVQQDILKILLIQRKNPPFKGKYSLPGGFVNPNEDLDVAVKRELFEETGVKDIFLKQLKTYGAPKRDPRARIISVAYLALISPDKEPKAGTDAKRAIWQTCTNLPNLAFDHNIIFQDALNQLRLEIQTTNIALQILPRKFTLTQFQILYENILDKKMDKRNFRKRIKALNILTGTKEMFMDGAHRPAKLYEFSEKTYQDIKDKVHIFLG